MMIWLFTKKSDVVPLVLCNSFTAARQQSPVAVPSRLDGGDNTCHDPGPTPGNQSLDNGFDLQKVQTNQDWDKLETPDFLDALPGKKRPFGPHGGPYTAYLSTANVRRSIRKQSASAIRATCASLLRPVHALV